MMIHVDCYDLSDDCCLVLKRLFERQRDRALAGHAAYGPLVLAGDKRNWAKEAAEELLDGAFYATCQEITDDEG